MQRDVTRYLWLLKLGALANLFFMGGTLASPADPAVALPALVLFAVSAWRCLFPVRYEGHVVLHDSPCSSIFVTRLLATFSEVGYIGLFALVLWRLDTGQTAWVRALAVLMAAQVVVSQAFVWAALLRGRRILYFYEELGWALIFAANTAASLALAAGGAVPPDQRILLWLNLAFGALYLPWQFLHLRMLLAAGRNDRSTPTPLAEGFARIASERNRRTDSGSWGGWIGLSWMTGYWATLIPAWVYLIVRVLS